MISTLLHLSVEENNLNAQNNLADFLLKRSFYFSILQQFFRQLGPCRRARQAGHPLGGPRQAGSQQPRHVLPGQVNPVGPAHISAVPALHRGAVEGQICADGIRQKEGVSAG